MSMREAQNGQKPSSFAGVFMRGAVWMVAMRWIVRGLGLISTAVLARILLPEDFGLVAMALVVVGFAEVLTNFGADMALLRDKGADREDINTVWTIRLCQAVFATLCIIGISFFAGDFLGDQRVVAVIQVASLTVLIGGLENIGVVLFRKEFNYVQDFIFNFAKKCISVLISISLALLLRSYWALVLAQVLAALSGTLFSYYLSDYRPNFSLSRLRKIFGFSQWILVLGMGSFIKNNGDRLIVARLSAVADLGIYTVAKEIAMMVTYELTLPISRALFPAMAQLIDDKKRFSRAFCVSFSGGMAIAAPAAIGLAMVGPEFIPVLLGPGWEAVIPFLQVITFAGLAQVFAGLCANALLVLNQPRIVATITWIEAALIVLGVFAGYEKLGILAAPYAILAAAVVTVILYLVCLSRRQVMGILGLFHSLWRTMVACGVMMAAVQFTWVLLGDCCGTLVSLLAEVTAGAFCYVITIMALWLCSSRPDCLEARVYEQTSRRLKFSA